MLHSLYNFIPTLDTFLDEQSKLRQRKSQKEQEFFSGLENRNLALSTAFDQDTVDFEEYFKKSNDFNEKIMSLIKVQRRIISVVPKQNKRGYLRPLYRPLQRLKLRSHDLPQRLVFGLKLYLVKSSQIFIKISEI